MRELAAAPDVVGTELEIAAKKSPRKPKGSGHLRRSEILEAAQRIFAEFGYEGATVRKIAEQVGVSSTAIYLHFPDKRAMLMEIAAAAIGPLLTEAQAIAADDKLDPLERARRMMLAYLRFGRENASAYEVVFCAAQREIADKNDPSWTIFAAYHRSFLGVITELAEAGRLRTPDSRVAAQTLWAGCHGLVTLMRSNPQIRWSPYEDLREAMVEGLLRGLVKS